LLKERGVGIIVIEEVVKITARNKESKEETIMLLLE